MKSQSNSFSGCSGFKEQTTILSTYNPGDGWTRVQWSNSEGTTLKWERGENEIGYDLTALLNRPLILSLIDLFFDKIRRTSSLCMKWVPGEKLPYQSRTGRADLFLKMTFDFQYHTPWYCTDAKGRIDYFIDCRIDEFGSIEIQFHGWGFAHEGGGPFAKDEISAILNADIPEVMDILQEQFYLFPELLDQKSLYMQS